MNANGRLCFPPAALRLATLLLVCLASSTAYADLQWLGGAGGTAFGVGTYGAPTVAGAPTFTLNAGDGLNDILQSPGSGFQTSNMITAFNISSTGVIALPYVDTLFQIGGSNANGFFGSGTSFIGSTGSYGHTLNDVNPDGTGRLAYVVSTWTDTWQVVGAPYRGTIGNILPLSGRLNPTATSTSVASLMTQVTIGDGAADQLPALVLAFTHSQVIAVGGEAGNTAAGIIAPATGIYHGLAVNSKFVDAAIPVGTKIKVVNTYTAQVDPAMSFTDGTLLTDPTLLAMIGTQLPQTAFAFGTTIPEPTAVLVFVAGLALLAGYRRIR